MALLKVRRCGDEFVSAEVDDDDYDQLAQWSWSLGGGGDGYVRRWTRKGGPRAVYLHRQLLGLKPGDGLEGDHRDGNPLNNRRNNLRVVTHAQQQENIAAIGRSRHRGVSFHKPTGKWRAEAQLRGKRHHLGLFADEDAAGEAASRFRAEHMPFAVAR